jgi:hypothetical protein
LKKRQVVGESRHTVLTGNHTEITPHYLFLNTFKTFAPNDLDHAIHVIGTGFGSK